MNWTDYALYLPLLPEAAAVVDPRLVTLSIPGTLPGVRLALGEVTEVAAQGPLFTRAIARRHRELAGQKMRWFLQLESDRQHHHGGTAVVCEPPPAHGIPSLPENSGAQVQNPGHMKRRGITQPTARSREA
ncbi:hypothetical protein [Nonomuraea cypriaca]|uniref:hypothetical protein n=1 Tax=Nonomuraea cypriaca TaxID=1187855 RepID=UPI001F479346|nr:hypothetical protein [Nonomuraea cypriaca]